MTTATLEMTTESAATGDIVTIVSQNPRIVLLDKAKGEEFVERIKEEAKKFVADTSTAKGREIIRANAARVTRTKTRIEEARLGLTKEWRDKTAQANEAGKIIKTQLEALAEEVRAPLTEWEDAEKARKEECRAVIDGFKAAAMITLDDTAEDVRQRGFEVYETALDPERFDDLLEEAEAAKASAVETLQRAFERLTKEEADRAELKRLQAAEAERLEQERIDRERREAEERAAAEAKAEEERQAAAAAAEQERLRAAEEAAAQAARDKAAREAQAEIDAANERARKAEEDAKAERDRIAQEKADREAAEARAAEEQRRREANQRHRTAVKSAAKKAIMAVGADEDTATKIVLAIIAGEIPNVTLAF